VAEKEIAEGIIRVGKEHLEKSECIFVEMGNGEIRAYSTVNLEERFKVACIKICKEASQVNH
jgi:hypothetical protein